MILDRGPGSRAHPLLYLWKEDQRVEYICTIVLIFGVKHVSWSFSTSQRLNTQIMIVIRADRIPGMVASGTGR